MRNLKFKSELLMRAMFEIKIEVVVIPYLLKTFTSPQAKDTFHRYLTCCLAFTSPKQPTEREFSFNF